MPEQTILAIDQGTTSSRAILFSAHGEILALKQKELTLTYPQKGWVEQNANDIWQDTLECCRAIIKDNPTLSDAIAAIGITNQRETTVIWDRNTGKPIYNAIVWQDRRTANLCRALKQKGHQDTITDKTGLLLDPYFSATKISWILDNVEGARKKTEAGELAFGTIDSFLIWHLTNGKNHVTDITNASRTMLYNIRTQEWDDDLLKLFKIPRALLPEVKDNVADFGQTDADHFGKSLTIGGVAGDQQAALIGQACFKEKMIKSTYGTGCFALMNIGPKFKKSNNQLLTTPAYRLNNQITYAIEGSIFVSGAAIQWLRDGLGLFDDAKESEALATSVPDNNGVYFVPAFTGLGAPYWNPDARALISGLSRESTKAHITRAALEAQAYQTRDLLTAMAADTGFKPEIIRADGGLVANSFVCQFISDILNVQLDIPTVQETTALGAAYLAGLHAGIYKDLDDVAEKWQIAKQYKPAMGTKEADSHYQEWQALIKKALLD
jgi:glycerol kinase